MINLARHEIAEKNLFKLAEFSCALYIITLYLFVDHPKYIFISEICFFIFLFFSLSCILYNKTIYLGIYVWLPITFIIYSLGSYFWSINGSAVVSKTKTLILLLIFIILVYNVFYVTKRIDFILKSLIFAGLCLSIYSFILYGYDTIVHSMSTNSRLGGEISQENTYGMLLATTVVLCAYFYIFHKERKYLFISAIPFIFAMSSGSRKSIIIIVSGVILLLYLKNGMKRLYKFIIALVVFLLVFNYIVQLPAFYSVNHRMNSFINLFTGEGPIDSSATYRQVLIRQGIEWFKNRPLFGYGMANYKYINSIYTYHERYSHNNFIEILVGLGLVGFSLYYMIYTYVLVKIAPGVKERNKECIAVFVLIINRLVIDLASVSYDNKITWFYIVLGFITISKYEFDKKTQQNI